MKILLTNDDGIDAIGLQKLHAAIKTIAEPIVVAPHIERSAVGHAITLSDPLRVIEKSNADGFYGYALTGTPADCVKLAIKTLLPEPPDLIISGINLGSNLGTSVIYSGTVSAATEGIILGIPSIAMSLDTYLNPDFSYAQKFIADFVEHFDPKTMPPDIALNINIPAVSESKIEGVEVTTQGKFRFEEYFDKRTDPQARVYYWLSGKIRSDQDAEGSDSYAVKNNKVSITPIHYDMTNHQSLTTIKKMFNGIVT